ncbi:hypothetical protein B0J14DRAFT_687514 [Halenospora varia]|nr:hypothetical protein B0J14DRAFT_687514 [Halenospora varia]
MDLPKRELRQGETLSRLHHMLKLHDDDDNQFPRDVILVSIDLEVSREERVQPHPRVREVGISTFDTRHLHSACKTAISTPITTTQWSTVHNSEDFEGCDFTDFKECLFAKTRKIKWEQVWRKVEKAISIKDDRDPAFFRKVAIVGHSPKYDLEVLKRLGLDIPSLAHVVAIFDTHLLAKKVFNPRALLRQRETKERWTVASVLERVNWPYNKHDLHNAGNDATYTMYVLLMLALISRDRQEDGFTMVEAENNNRLVSMLKFETDERELWKPKRQALGYRADIPIYEQPLGLERPANVSAEKVKIEAPPKPYSDPGDQYLVSDAGSVERISLKDLVGPSNSAQMAPMEKPDLPRFARPSPAVVEKSASPKPSFNPTAKSFVPSAIAGERNTAQTTTWISEFESTRNARILRHPGLAHMTSAAVKISAPPPSRRERRGLPRPTLVNLTPVQSPTFLARSSNPGSEFLVPAMRNSEPARDTLPFKSTQKAMIVAPNEPKTLHLSLIPVQHEKAHLECFVPLAREGKQKPNTKSTKTCPLTQNAIVESLEQPETLRLKSQSVQHICPQLECPVAVNKTEKQILDNISAENFDSSQNARMEMEMLDELRTPNPQWKLIQDRSKLPNWSARQHLSLTNCTPS